MKVAKKQVDCYVLTEVPSLDPITVYVTNYAPGQGKVVIECFGDAWAYYWGAMGGMTLQQFFITCSNDYILNKLLPQTRETDFEAINKALHRNGYDTCVTNDVGVALSSEAMGVCFGPDWFMDVPQRATKEYHYLGRIVDAIKNAFAQELEEK